MICSDTLEEREEALENTWAARTDEILRSLESAPRSDAVFRPMSIKKAVSE